MSSGVKTSAARELSELRIPKLRQRNRALLASGILLLSDVLTLCFAAVLAYAIRNELGGDLEIDQYSSLLPTLLIFPAAYATRGLYPAFGLGPVDELRRLSHTTSIVYIVLAAGTFVFKGGVSLSRGVFFLAWMFSLAAVWLGRALVRNLVSNTPWWGYSVVVIGAAKTGQMVVRALRKRPDFGLKPVLFVDDDPATWGFCEGLPVIGGTECAADLAERHGWTYAIVATPGASRDLLLQILERSRNVFHHVLLIPNLFGVSSLWTTPKDLEGILGLEVREQLALRHCMVAKRSLDIALSLAGGLLILPVMLIIAILIKFESRGPVFYSHERIGQRGKKFRAWKFRSMVKDADQILGRYLIAHPEFRVSWEKDQKVRNDPRLTRVGRILRRTSLDELPQLLNVLNGEMSLVGPRPIVESEIAKYGDRFSLYSKVLPGITGLWQVSGRNDISYAERVDLDSYYVRNWSVWLDIYVLALTVKVVLSTKGAY